MLWFVGDSCLGPWLDSGAYEYQSETGLPAGLCVGFASCCIVLLFFVCVLDALLFLLLCRRLAWRGPICPSRLGRPLLLHRLVVFRLGPWDVSTCYFFSFSLAGREFGVESHCR